MLAYAYVCHFGKRRCQEGKIALYQTKFIFQILIYYVHCYR
jgi:hypothetical protein